jgi:aminobenzoyl-glutamate utilization protein B
VPPREHEAAVRRALPPWQENYTSDDYVEYTWHAPTGRLLTSRAHLREPEPGCGYPMWVFNATSGIPCMIDPAIFAAGRTIGASIVELLCEPAELEKAPDEFSKRTGGGIGGSQWVALLLPKDFKPPVDLRWPEYVTTPRGEEWWIPTPSD